MPVGTLPPKREVARALLQKGSLFIHLDPRALDVRVPAWLTQQPQLVLQVGYDMVIPIPDLCVDDDGVFGTLSFSRSPFACFVPWDAVFALVGDDGRGMVWPESMPAEIAAEVDREALRAKHAAEQARGLPQHPPEAHFERARGLAAVRSAASHPDSEPASAKSRLATSTDSSTSRRGSGGAGSSPRPKRELPPYLRVVK